jgi:hypothetical protein
VVGELVISQREDAPVEDEAEDEPMAGLPTQDMADLEEAREEHEADDEMSPEESDEAAAWEAFRAARPSELMDRRPQDSMRDVMAKIQDEWEVKIGLH